MKFVLQILLIIFTAQMAFADAVIFSGADVKTLKPNIDLFGASKIMSGSVDPTSSATSAPIGSLYLNTTTGLSYRKLDAGSSTNWVVLGSGSSSGKNYITNPDAEANVAGWSAYADTAAASPVDCTGGSPSVTVTRTTSSPLAGIGSFLLTKGASNLQGQGISIPFVIDSTDKAKVLTAKLENLISSGTFVAGTKTTDSDLGIFIYNVTDGVMIEPSNKKFYSNSATLSENFAAQLQSSSSSTSYRLCIHVASTSTAAYTTKFDNVSVSPSDYIYGSPVTDWQAYTPTGTFTTNSTYLGYWRRNGQDLEGMVRISFAGAPNAVTLSSISIPPGLTIDSSGVGINNVLGTGSAFDNGVNRYSVDVYYASTTTVNPQVKTTSGSFATISSISNTSPFTIGSTDTIEISFKVPIVGWSSSVKMSDNADTRLVDFAAFIGTSVSVPNNTQTKLLFNSVTKDSHGTYDTTNSRYVVPVAGDYQITIRNEAVSYAAATDIQFNVYKNGVADSLFFRAAAAVANTYEAPTTLIIPNLKVGDYLEVFVIQNSGGSVTLGSGAPRPQFKFQGALISAPTAIAASEDIVAKYRTTSGQSISNSSDVIVDYSTKVYDSHGAVTTGASWKFTAPVAGKYSIRSATTYQPSTYASGNAVYLQVFKNGVVEDLLFQWNIEAAATLSYTAIGSSTISLNAGDYLDIRAANSRTAGATLLTTASKDNYVVIEKIAN